MSLFEFNCPAAVVECECVLVTIVKRTALFQIFLMVLLFVLNNTKFASLNKPLESSCACSISSGTQLRCSCELMTVQSHMDNDVGILKCSLCRQRVLAGTMEAMQFFVNITFKTKRKGRWCGSTL